MEPAWSRFLSPVLRLRNILTPGGADQKETPEYLRRARAVSAALGARRRARLRDRAARGARRGDGPSRASTLRVSSSAVDTDFTAKLVDVHPPNEDYPDGYDMLINDSIIRCRFREGFEQEVFMEPGEVVEVTIELPPTSNLFDRGHRIRLDVSSSNFPRLDLNPNTGEPIGRHTHQVVAEQAVHGGTLTLPVIPLIDWVAIPAGPFPMGIDPARAYPPDEDETPRRVVSVEGFRIGRTPVTGDDGVPLTYVSRADAEAFCAENGVRLPTEIEWEAAARGGDDRLWPWGDELPDTTRATFGQGIGGPSPVGLHPAGAAPCGALDLAGNVFEWTADGAARGGSYLSGPDELRCSARLPGAPGGARSVRRLPRRRRRAAPRLRLGRGARRRLRDRPRPGRDAAAARRRGRVRARADTGHERAVRALRRRDRSDRRRPTGRPRQTIPSPSSTGTRRPPSAPGPAAGCRPRPSGRRRPAAPTGAPTRGATRRTRAAPRSAPGSSTAPPSPVGSHPDGASPYGLLDMAGNVWEWTSTEYPPGERVLRGGSFASPGLAWARCTMRSHSRPVRRQAHIGFRVARDARA